MQLHFCLSKTNHEFEGPLITTKYHPSSEKLYVALNRSSLLHCTKMDLDDIREDILTHFPKPHIPTLLSK